MDRAPNRRQKHLVCDDLASIAGQGGEHLIFLGPQLDAL